MPMKKVRKAVLVDDKNFTYEINTVVEETNVAPETLDKHDRHFVKEETHLAEVVIYREKHD